MVLPVMAAKPDPVPPANADPFVAVRVAIDGLQAQINTLTANVGTAITALQTKDTDLETQINNIPGPVHFGDYDRLYAINVEHEALTDGFVLGLARYAGAEEHPVVYIQHNPYALVYIVPLIPGRDTSFSVPVRAGETWEVTLYPAPSSDWSFAADWLPLTAS